MARAKSSAGTPRFPSGAVVTLTDQFADAKSFALAKPRHLCFPVDVNGEEMIDPTPKLFCYVTKALRGEPPHRGWATHIADEFGVVDVNTVKEREVCLPSTVE